jgi:hypothetical protein
MTAVARAWLGFFALGAGLIHLALVIGSPLAIGIPLLVVGIAEFVWGVFAFTSPRVPLARVARVAALVPILGWVALLVLAGAAGLPDVRVLPMLVASLLDIAVAATITALLRQDPARDPRPLRSGTYLLALGAGALVVAALTTPALAATEAGDLAQPHGDYEPHLPDGHPGH